MGNLREIVRDLASPKVLPALSQGVIIGILLVVVEVSFASMIFSGPLAAHATRAAGLTIFGAMILSLCTGLFSPFRSMISLPQDSPVAVMSGTSAVIAGTLAAAAPQAQFATVAAVMGFSALITAAAFLFVGWFKLSNLVRFLPYPVVGGFLAGSGVMLFLGGFGVMTGRSLTLDTLGVWCGWPVMRFWLPGAAYALGVFVLMKRKPHFMILPLSLAVGMAAFYAVMAWQGVSPDAARAAGWLLGELPGQGLWPAFGAADVAAVQWGSVLAAVPDMLTMALLSLVGLLLNVGGIELGARQDIDMDRELLVGAGGNLVAGCGGAFAGYSTLSLSLLGPRTGTDTRLIPLFAALVCAGVLFLGAEALTYFPKALLGGLVLLLGLFFLDDWIFTAWRRLAWTDYGIVVVITAAIAQAGFLEGVGLGLLLAAAIFLVRLSRVPVVAESTDGTVAASGRQRSVPDRALLRRKGAEIRVFTLRGYVFFGSANALAGHAEPLLKGEAPLHSLVVDMTGIDGFDISAVNVFQRMAQQAQVRGAGLVFAAAPAEFHRLLELHASAEAREHVAFLDTREAALAWCEDALLEREHARIAAGGGERRDALFDLAAEDMDAHLHRLERFEALMDRVQPHAVRLELADGAQAVAAADAPEGALFVLFGELVERGADGAERGTGQGDVALPAAALAVMCPGTAVAARGRTEALVLSPGALSALEQADPDAAFGVHRLLSGALAERA